MMCAVVDTLSKGEALTVGVLVALGFASINGSHPWLRVARVIGSRGPGVIVAERNRERRLTGGHQPNQATHVNKAPTLELSEEWKKDEPSLHLTAIQMSCEGESLVLCHDDPERGKLFFSCTGARSYGARFLWHLSLLLCLCAVSGATVLIPL